ncbi:MAG: DUF3488 and transglutaminase-like domain-containing protein [Pseudomonadales bacterium]|nr:DUF3488 and transglutaminase-like domain-containing protein [Pseudomonadales bacterium]
MNSAALPRSSFLWLLISVGAVLLPHVNRMPTGLLIGYGLCMVWRTLVHYGKAKMPHGLVKLLLVIAGTLIIRQGYQNLLGVDPAAAFLLLTFVFKFLEMQRVRDGLLIIFLGYFCLPITFLFSQTMVMTIYVFVALVVLTTTLVKVTKTSDQAGATIDLKQVTVMLLSALPLMLVLFVLVPRIGPLWSVPLPSGQSKTGPSDSMSPGDIASLAKSDELAFRVRFDGAIPDTRELYWRGLVFSNFDGRTWRPEGTPFQQQKNASWARNSAHEEMEESLDIHYQVTFEPSYQPWLYALDYPLTSGSGIGLTPQYTLLNKVSVDQRKHYNLVSSPRLMIDSVLDPASRKRNLLIPRAGNSRAKKFAIEQRNKASSDQQFVTDILTYYRQKPFYYSLKPPRLGPDSIDEFMFDTRKGFCEHYAGSFTYIMRAAGIPARVVVGYQGGEINHSGNYLLVHQFDAHAWAEVWLQDRGWVRIDPTGQVAPERIEQGIEEATAYENSFLSDSTFSLLRYRDNLWLSQLRLKLDAIEYDWNRWVLGYNAKRQSDFLKDYLGLVSSASKTQLLTGLVTLFLIALMVVFLRKERIKITDRCDQLYFRFCRLMETRGVARGAAEGATDFSQRLVERFSAQEQSIRNITRMYNYLSYGPDINPHQRSRILKKLEQEIAALKRT